MTIKRLDRRQGIVDLLRNGEVHAIAGMATVLGVSDETIRRELRLMENAGLIERHHGGARLSRPVEEGPFDVRMQRNSAAKTRIAEAVAELVHDGQSLYLDASSTAFHVARALKRRRHLTIITNALAVAGELGGRAGNRLCLAGGELDDDYRAFFDQDARTYLMQFRPDLAILSTESVDLVRGFTDYHIGEAAVCRQMIGQSARCLMALDASKFGRNSVAAVATLSEIDILVTDQTPADAYNKAFPGAALIVC